MITRPLDLASRLRPEPRTLYWLFFVNAGLLVLFFSLFGSRFVLAPGLGVDFRLPSVQDAGANAGRPTHVIAVMRSGQILTPNGPQPMDAFATWLRSEAKGTRSPLLLVQTDSDGPISVLTEISSMAKSAGFDVLLATTEASAPPTGGGSGK